MTGWEGAAPGPAEPPVLVGAAAAAAAPAAPAHPRLLPSHPVDSGGELDCVQRLAVVRRLGGDVGQQGRLAGDRAKKLPQQLSHSALLEREVALAIKDCEDDVSEPGLGDASSQCPRPLATSEVNEVETGAATEDLTVLHTAVGALPQAHRVLVDVDCEDEMRVPALQCGESGGAW